MRVGRAREGAGRGIVVETRFHGSPTRFVGRTAEMDNLLGAVGQTLRDVRSRLLTAVGPVGIGLSRLLLEFSGELEREDWVVLTSLGGLEQPSLTVNLAALRSRGLIRPRRASSFPEEQEYGFCESAVQLVAYEMLGQAARQSGELAVKAHGAIDSRGGAMQPVGAVSMRRVATVCHGSSARSRGAPESPPGLWGTPAPTPAPLHSLTSPGYHRLA